LKNYDIFYFLIFFLQISLSTTTASSATIHTPPPTTTSHQATTTSAVDYRLSELLQNCIQLFVFMVEQVGTEALVNILFVCALATYSVGGFSGEWFSSGTLVSFTNKNDRHD
jgi:hypothetical protein